MLFPQKMTVFWITVSLAILIQICSGLKCIKKIGDCACETDEGVIDLSKLDKPGQMSASYSFDRGGGQAKDTWKVLWNPCQNVDTSQDASSCTSGTADCNGQKGCIIALAGQYAGSCFGLGGEATFIDTPGSQPLQVQYKHTGSDSYNRVFTNSLICGTGPQTYSIITDSESVTANLTSFSGICSGGGGGLSFGAILLIIFFVTGFLYLIGGIIFQKFIRKQELGLDLIPNRGLWVQFFGLIKNGAVFSFKTIKNLVTRKGLGGNYQEV